MPSPLFVSLRGSLDSLRKDLIVSGKAYYAYTSGDHARALGFRVLASAHLEDYAEQRCAAVAKAGIQRLKRQQPTRTGVCLMTWYFVREEDEPIPLDVSEFNFDDKLDSALSKYERMVSKKHGISASNLRNLVVPLGVREADLDEHLFNLLQDLAVSRGAAAHIKVNRAKQMQEPEQEWKKVSAVLPLLEKLDEGLDAVLEDRPIV
ncbi:hypothetical protein [Amycolatopsis orientalis]|uniref:hypothetical protein n=1 Tax=Amycolatopsis orientalis TaxID=31958 RepID=UPI0011AB8101|nr:hypothetical protein [Amycolatopsis orientalis]